MKARVIRGFSNISIECSSVITIGKFDGVHIGHQKLIKRSVDIAKKNNMKSIAIVFSKGSDNLYPLEENIKIIESFGINYIVVIDFSDKFYRMYPKEFFCKLIQYYNMKHVVVGSDFRFGVNRSGDTKMLKALAIDYNKTLGNNSLIKVDTITPKKMGGIKVSTTGIIKYLSSGKLSLVKKMLGRDYSITGKVYKGKQLGRSIGYPTANLYVGNIINIPKEGVYFSVVIIDNVCYKSMTFIGNSKINDIGFRLEAYLFDFNRDIYNKTITVYLLKYSRENIKVNSKDELITLLKRDEIQANNYFKRRKKCL